MDSTSLAIVLAVFGLLLILLSYRRLVQHRIWSALGHGVAGAIIFLIGAVLFALALNFNTYERLQTDQPIAQLSFDKSAAHSYQVSLMRIPSGDLQVFNLSGEQWHVEARQLIWTGWLQWFGLHSDIRLQTLLSSSVSANTSGVAIHYALSRNPGIDLWKLRETHAGSFAKPLTLRLLTSEDAPLTDGLRYHIYLTGDALQARQINKRIEPNLLPAPASAVNAAGPQRSALSSASSSSSISAAKSSVPHK